MNGRRNIFTAAATGPRPLTSRAGCMGTAASDVIETRCKLTKIDRLITAIRRVVAHDWAHVAEHAKRPCQHGGLHCWTSQHGNQTKMSMNTTIPSQKIIPSVSPQTLNAKLPAWRRFSNVWRIQTCSWPKNARDERNAAAKERRHLTLFPWLPCWLRMN